MTIGTERDRVIKLLAQLPEEDYALFRLGQGLRRSLWAAGINGTEADMAYIQEVATRIRTELLPNEVEDMQRWMAPGGALRWSEL